MLFERLEEQLDVPAVLVDRGHRARGEVLDIRQAHQYLNKGATLREMSMRQESTIKASLENKLVLCTTICVGLLLCPTIPAQGSDSSLSADKNNPPLYSLKKFYDSTEADGKPGYVRVSNATVTFTESGRAILRFQASSMTDAHFPDEETAPWLSIRFVKQDGRYIGPWLDRVAVATVGTCKGPQVHTVDISAFMAADLLLYAILDAVSFDLKMSGAQKVHGC